MADDARMLGYIVVRPNPNLGVGWSIVDRTLWADSKDATAWADEAIGEGRYRVARCVVLTWPIIHDGSDTWEPAPPEAREERSWKERRVRHIGGNRFMRDGDENQVWPGSRATFDRRTQPNRGRAARRGL